MLIQISLLRDLCVRAFRQQHPHRNLQALSHWVNNRDGTISSFRSAHNLKTSAMKWMERIENCDAPRFCAQGILRADGIIPISIA